MTILNLAVSASADDAGQTANAVISSIAATTAPIGTGVPADSIKRAVGARFLNVTIPQGSTINSAAFKYASVGDWVTTYLHTYAEAADNAATWANSQNIGSRTRTTATVFCNGDDINRTAGVFYSWPVSGGDVAALVQEVINRAGWVSGNALMMISYGDHTSAGSGNVRLWDFAANPGPTLVIDYTATVTIDGSGTPAIGGVTSAVSGGEAFSGTLAASLRPLAFFASPLQVEWTVADVSDAGLWTNELGATSPLYTSVNEIVADDTTFIQSPIAPTNAPVVIRLGVPFNPVPGAQIVLARLGKDLPGGSPINQTVELMQGASVLQTWRFNDVAVLPRLNDWMYNGLVLATPGLRGFFPLTESAASPTVADVSGQAHTPGAVHGAVTLGDSSVTPSAPATTSTSYPGLSTAYIDFGDHNDWSFVTTGTLTIEIAVTLTALPSALSALVSKMAASQYEWEIDVSTAGYVSFNAWTLLASNYLTLSASPSLSLNVPHLIVVTVDTAATPRAHIILDGNTAGKSNSTDSGVTIANGTAPMLTGKRADDFRPLANARLGQLSIYNVVLSDADIAAHYAAWLTPSVATTQEITISPGLITDWVTPLDLRLTGNQT